MASSGTVSHAARVSVVHCAVVGSSVAASGAVDVLLKAGASVLWTPYLYDNGCVESTRVLEVDGIRAPVEHLAEFGMPGSIARTTDGRWTLRPWGPDGGVSIRHAQSVIFAPYGTETALEELALGTSLLNVFAALEASTNVMCVRGMRVLAYGRGYRALEAAAWLATEAQHVTLCVEDELARWTHTSLWARERLRFEGMQVLERCSGLRVHARDPRRGPWRVEVRLRDAVRDLGCFDFASLTMGLRPDYSGFDEALRVIEPGQWPRFEVAGIAAGVEHEAHARQWESGAAAARRVLSTLR